VVLLLLIAARARGGLTSKLVSKIILVPTCKKAPGNDEK
jgi:hypothetical protein